MAYFNKVVLIGNLTANPQLKYLNNGTAIAEFQIAVNRKYSKDGVKKDEVGFFPITFFGKQAETIVNFAGKGSSLLVEGRLKYDTWEKDGAKRSKITIIGEGFQFIGAKSGSNFPKDDQSPDDIVDDLPIEEDIPF